MKYEWNLGVFSTIKTCCVTFFVLFGNGFNDNGAEGFLYLGDTWKRQEDNRRLNLEQPFYF
jgi:hypothetical protein